MFPENYEGVGSFSRENLPTGYDIRKLEINWFYSSLNPSQKEHVDRYYNRLDSVGASIIELSPLVIGARVLQRLERDYRENTSPEVVHHPDMLVAVPDEKFMLSYFSAIIRGQRVDLNSRALCQIFHVSRAVDATDVTGHYTTAVVNFNLKADNPIDYVGYLIGTLTNSIGNLNRECLVGNLTDKGFRIAVQEQSQWHSIYGKRD